MAMSFNADCDVIEVPGRTVGGTGSVLHVSFERHETLEVTVPERVSDLAGDHWQGTVGAGSVGEHELLGSSQ